MHKPQWTSNGGQLRNLLQDELPPFPTEQPGFADTRVSGPQMTNFLRTTYYLPLAMAQWLHIRAFVVKSYMTIIQRPLV